MLFLMKLLFMKAVVLLLALLQDLEEPAWLAAVVAALVALFAIPIVYSLATGVLQRFTNTTGLNPRIILYALCAVVTLYVLRTNPPVLPVFESSNPGEFVAAWLLLLKGWVEWTDAIYQKYLKEFTIFNPPRPD